MEFKKIANEAREGLRSARGRNLLTFVVFLAISTVFWFLLALNDDVQRDYTVPVRLEDFPSDCTILSGYNPVLSVSVKDKGSALLRYAWGKTPTVKLHMEDFSRQNDSTLILSAARLNAAVRGIFGTGANIVTLRPDSLRISYTSNPGIKVAVNVRSDIHTEPQYAYAGHPVLTTDSVMLYSNSPERFAIHTLSTPVITLANLTDSVTMNVKLETRKGMRAIPPSVQITFPVEPLVAKTQRIPIEVVNIPFGVRVVAFPSLVEVTYLMPKSYYKRPAPKLKATVDYNEISPAVKALPVVVNSLPAPYRGVTVTPAQVEYVVERAD